MFITVTKNMEEQAFWNAKVTSKIALKNKNCYNSKYVLTTKTFFLNSLNNVGGGSYGSQKPHSDTLGIKETALSKARKNHVIENDVCKVTVT